jgi:hypothetical protein
MPTQGWQIGCLYNQETEEHPELFSSHIFTYDDAISLTHETRLGMTTRRLTA